MNYKHGHTKNRKRSSEHSVWTDMLKRCSNVNSTFYKRYGGRGITVSLRWIEFKNFVEDMGPRPKGYTLERLDNDKGYSKENCIWATRKQQARNRSSNRMITLFGEVRPLAEWCENRKLNYARVYARILKLGWSPEKALEV